MPKIILNLPIDTVSEMNCSQHWRVKSKRHKSQQFFVRLAMNKHKVNLPCTVTMIRLSPRDLDDDNLSSAFKWIRDELSECLIPNSRKTYINGRGKTQEIKGRADSDKRIKWLYGQEKAKIKGIRIEIDFEAESTPQNNGHADTQ